MMLTFALLALGCPPREHLRKDFSMAYRARFDRQQIYHEASAEQTIGLDSEEAAAIHAKYRSTLADNKGGEKAQPQILLLETTPGKKRK
jgi:hypothetical protein